MVTLEHRETRVTRLTLIASLALVLAATGTAGAQSRFSGIVVFGTSLSDPGNAFVVFGEQSTAPDYLLNPLLVPDAPYARGGHHFSNGATWVEQYARSIGLGDSVRPALATTDPSVTNFAFGAARAYNDGRNFNLSRQVDAFLLRSNGVASAQALYVIEMGGNDLRDALGVYAAGGNGGPILTQAIGSIAANIQRLYAAGAREFLVWTAPNVALTPAIRSLGPAAVGLGDQLAQAFNGGLDQALGQLAMVLPGSQFSRLDAYQLLATITTSPDAFGLVNVSGACVTPSVAPFACTNPDDFLFWDGIHPTKAGHAIIAREAASVLQ